MYVNWATYTKDHTTERKISFSASKEYDSRLILVGPYPYISIAFNVYNHTMQGTLQYMQSNDYTMIDKIYICI